MCLTDAKQLSGQSGDIARQKQGLCNSAAAYIEACEEQGVALDLPSQCGKFFKIKPEIPRRDLLYAFSHMRSSWNHLE